MVFTTNLFLFSFLPLVLVCYYALPLLQNGMAKLAAKWSSDANTLHGHSSRVTSVAARPDTVPRARNGFLLLASYIFYGWWNPWFLPLIAAVTLGNYHCGRYVSGSGRSQRQRWWGTALAVTVSLGALGFFKYFNFVAANVNHVLAWLGADAEGKSRQLVYGEDGRHVYGGHVSPDGKYVLFTGNVEEDGDPGNAGADGTDAPGRCADDRWPEQGTAQAPFARQRRPSAGAPSGMGTVLDIPRNRRRRVSRELTCARLEVLHDLRSGTRRVPR